MQSSLAGTVFEFNAILTLDLCAQRNFEIELGDDLKQLSFYAMESGDTILLRW